MYKQNTIDASASQLAAIMSRLTTVVAVLAILQTSTALICKNCNVDCENPTDETCLEPGEDQKVSCLIEKFKDQKNNTLYQRKCVLYDRKIETFECADYPSYQSLACVTCDTDLCNQGGVGGKNATVGNTARPFNATV